MITAIVCSAFTGSFLVFTYFLFKTRYELPDEDALKDEEIKRVCKALDELEKNRKINRYDASETWDHIEEKLRAN